MTCITCNIITRGVCLKKKKTKYFAPSCVYDVGKIDSDMVEMDQLSFNLQKGGTCSSCTGKQNVQGEENILYL